MCPVDERSDNMKFALALVEGRSGDRLKLNFARRLVLNPTQRDC